jgi:hypothetical protein
MATGAVKNWGTQQWRDMGMVTVVCYGYLNTDGKVKIAM